MIRHPPPSLPFLNFHYRGHEDNSRDGEKLGSTDIRRGSFQEIGSGSNAFRLSFTAYIGIAVVGSREDVALLQTLATVSGTLS